MFSKSRWERMPSQLLLRGLVVSCLCLVGGTIKAAQATGKVVKEVVVTGNRMVKTDDIKYRLRTREGSTVDTRVLDEDFKRLHKMGYFSDVQIHQENTKDGGIRLRVVVKEKAVMRRVVFRGNQQVSTSTLKKQVTSAVGQTYDAGIVNQDVRKIEEYYRNNYYYFTEVETIKEPFEDGIRLVFQIKERGRVTIKDIEFHGNKALTKTELLKHMATQPAALMPWGPRGKYERRAFEQDLERLRLLYQTKGYLDVKIAERPFQITAREADSKWKHQHMIIHIDIDEGQVYSVGKIEFKVTAAEGKAVYSGDDLRKVIRTMPGSPYNAQQVAKDVRALQDHYGKNGRFFSTVRSSRVTAESGNIADVVFTVHEDKPVVVEDILVTGLTRTKEYVVRRELEMFPGEVYDTNKRKETEWNLNRLNYFERPVKIDVKKTGDGRGKVVVDLKEKRTGSISGGVGFSSADGVVGSFKLKERNFDHRGRPKNLKDALTLNAFKGGGENLVLDLTAGTKSSNYSLDFMNPWIFGRPLRFGMGGFHKTREWDDYDERRLGAHFLLGRKIFGKRWDISGTYRIETVDLKNMDDDVSDELKDEQGEALASRVIFKLTYDTRDDLFDPTSGWYFVASQEFVGGWLGGDKDFWRSRAEVNYWWNFWKDKRKRPHVLAFRAEGGLADGYDDDGKPPLWDRLFAGGMGSLRGFSHNSVSPQSVSGDSLGGEMLFTASIEYFFPLFGEKLRGSTFFDVGNVWGNMNDWDGDDWRSSIGAGIHVKTPLWQMPIGIYYSHILDKADYDDQTKTVQIRLGAYF